MLETQQHVDESNTVVRHIADWFGGADLPDEDVYTGVREHARQIMAEAESLNGDLEGAVRARLNRVPLKTL